MNPNAIIESEKLVADAIAAAEEIPDPLAGLAEKTAADSGAPFMPEALDALAALKTGNRAAFEALRSQLKKAGCRVRVLDDAIAEESGEAGGRGPTQADILIDLAQSAELFHTPDSTGFADLDINGHRETWPIRSKGFRHWLTHRYFEATGGAPSSEALQSALNVIVASAHFDAPERIVRPTVESGLTLDLYRLIRQGLFKPGQFRSGSIVWTRVGTGERVGSIDYAAHMEGAFGHPRERGPGGILSDAATGV
jgi:hypothetical protein